MAAASFEVDQADRSLGSGAVAEVERARRTLERAIAGPLSFEEELRARIGLAECRIASGDAAGAAKDFAPVLPHVDGEEDPALRARGRALAVVLAVTETGLDLPAWHEAEEGLLATGRTSSLWRLEVGLGRLLLEHGEPGNAAERFRRARDIASRYGIEDGVGPAALLLAGALAEDGRLVEAADSLEPALEAARAGGDRGALRICLERGIALAAATGHVGALLGRLREAAALDRDEGRIEDRIRHLSAALRAATGAGLGEAGGIAAELGALLLGPEGSAAAPETLAGAATDLEAAGHHEAARDLALAAARRAFSIGRPDLAAGSLAEAARLTDLLGDRGLSAAMWQEVVGLATRYELAERDAWEAEWAALTPGSRVP